MGLTIQWDCQNHAVHLLILGYVQKALTRFKHPSPNQLQYQPHPHVPPKYGQKQQFIKPEDNTTPLDKKKTKFIKEVTGTFLFYAQAVNSTMLTALNSIASQQAHPTEQTLDYAATNDKAVVTYHARSTVMPCI